MGQGTLGEVQDGSEDPQRGPGRVGDPRGGPGRVGSPRGGQGMVGRSTGRSTTGRGTLGEDRDGSEDPWGGPGWVVGPSERSGTGS